MINAGKDCNILEHCRGRIDKLDKEIINLLIERMKVVGKIAEYKHENHLPVTDIGREEDKKRTVREYLSKSGHGELAEYIEAVYEEVFRISRVYQEK